MIGGDKEHIFWLHLDSNDWENKIYLSINKNTLIDKIEEAINSSEIAVFVGAGLSIGAGFASWQDLLSSPAEEINLRIKEEKHDLVSLAQYYCNKKQRGAIDDLISKVFSENKQCTENHRILAALPVYNYWTTNYDNLIEKALAEAHKNPSVRSEDTNLKLPVGHYDTFVYKMHGDYTQPQNAVITRDDYEEYGLFRRTLFRDVLEGHLLTKTFLFLGFSFNDPNFRFVLSKIKVLLKGSSRKHYCIMRRTSRNEEVRDPDSYRYKELKLEYEIEDLARYGIEVCLIDEYNEQTEILNTLLVRYKRKTVFISGSAENYDPLGEKKAAEFVHGLTYGLVEKGYRIVSGFGKGIGSFVLNGVAEYCYSQHSLKISDFLTLMPFPLTASNNIELCEMWFSYRNEMIAKAGIAIFIFGNKLSQDGKLVLADGMDEEYEVSVKHKAVPLPIKMTGSKSSELFEKAIIGKSIEETTVLNLCGMESDSIQLIIENIIKAVHILNRRG